MRVWKFTRFSLLLLYFLSSVLELAGSVELNVAVELGTYIRINASPNTDSQCKVCIVQGRLCQTTHLLRSDTLLDFSCSQPEDVFTVQIIRDNVNVNIEPKDHSAFQKFNRTFTWNLKPLVTQSLQMNFSSAGLRQIQPSDGCPDKHSVLLMAENIVVGKFCQDGVIKRVDVRNTAQLSLEVAGGQRLDARVIGVTMGRVMNSLANIHVVLPEKSSTQDFFTPNAFPENAEVMWIFGVPNAYYMDARILTYTVPTCLQPESIPAMRYSWQGRGPVVKLLNGSQPSVEPGNFNLSITNCKMSSSPPPSLGLMVNFQISAIKRIKGQCEGDLPQNQILQIRVMRKAPGSVCVLKLDSLIMDTVTIASGNHFILNFFDCNKDELELTVNQTIECKESRTCTSTAFNLSFIYEQQCVPGVLKTITWLIYGPNNSGLELQAPAGGLRYCLPEDQPTSLLLLDVSHLSPSLSVGRFCPIGAVQKVQIRDSKITITASAMSFSDRTVATKPILTYSFTQYTISEHYIFTVAPKADAVTVLATPAWPSGMKSSSTVSWIVNTEPQFKSSLKFRDVSQPKCKELHTNIAVQTVRTQTTLYTTKKDQKINDVLAPESFFLNMTNCKLPTGPFRAVMEITLQENSNKLLGIILGVVGVLLLIVTAVVIWIILRKKKVKNKAPPVSVYNPSEHAFLPGLHGFPKAQEEQEDPHTYAYIDDTLVYSHLLRDDTDRRPRNDDESENGKPPLPDRPLRKTDEGKVLTDNELYGFIQGQTNTSGSPETPVRITEDGTYETKLCVWQS